MKPAIAWVITLTILLPLMLIAIFAFAFYPNDYPMRVIGEHSNRLASWAYGV